MKAVERSLSKGHEDDQLPSCLASSGLGKRFEADPSPSEWVLRHGSEVKVVSETRF